MKKIDLKKLMAPAIVAGLSAVLLAACSNEDSVHAQSQNITSSQGVLTAGAGNTTIPVKETPKAQGAVPKKGATVTIAAVQAAASPSAVSGNTTGITLPEGSITEADAKRIALEHAKVREADSSFLRVKLDYDDGILEYEVEFYVGSQEYDYDIDAASGTIRSFDYDIEDDYQHEANQPSVNIPSSGAGSQTSPSGQISEADAKAIALSKVPGASAADIRDFEGDWDDGRLKYEGEIKYNGRDYEFEIDAATGSILDWDEEVDD